MAPGIPTDLMRAVRPTWRNPAENQFRIAPYRRIHPTAPPRSGAPIAGQSCSRLPARYRSSTEIPKLRNSREIGGARNRVPVNPRNSILPQRAPCGQYGKIRQKIHPGLSHAAAFAQPRRSNPAPSLPDSPVPDHLRGTDRAQKYQIHAIQEK